MATINRKANEPPYRQMATQVRGQISSGEYPPGSPLPSVRTLAGEYGVNINTANRALTTLRQEGLVRTVQGKGYFVSEKPTVRRIDRNRAARADQRGFYADLQAAGLEPRVETKIDRRQTPAQVADILGIETGTEVLVRARHMAAGDKPLQLATTYFAPFVSESIPQLAEHNTGPGGFLSRFEDQGWMITQTDYVQASVPDSQTAATLQLEEGTAVLNVTRETVDQDDRVLEVTVLVIDGTRNQLVYGV